MVCSVQPDSAIEQAEAAVRYQRRRLVVVVTVLSVAVAGMLCSCWCLRGDRGIAKAAV